MYLQSSGAILNIFLIKLSYFYAVNLEFLELNFQKSPYLHGSHFKFKKRMFGEIARAEVKQHILVSADHCG